MNDSDQAVLIFVPIIVTLAFVFVGIVWYWMDHWNDER